MVYYQHLPTLEDAAFNLKASRWQVFTKVTFHYQSRNCKHHVRSFIESLADFGNPLILAGASFPVLSVQAYLNYRHVNLLLAVWLLVPSLIAFILQNIG